MNKDQRKYLLDTLAAQHKAEQEKLRDRRPKEPSLNNYLVAAILDGSFRMRPSEDVRKAIRDRVRDLGRDESLVTSATNRWNRRSEDEDVGMVNMPALLLFEEPEGYAVARKAYEEARERWDAEYMALDAAFKAMTLKVQLGSDAALKSLVDQADALCSMSLSAANQKLMLGPKTEDGP
jgi:hypothetical protein